ncbi:hypothetical protein L195_g015206 [Trifolium pratense]|uniref:Uncharacterized protein n=1 Tax=Trifolium pratense TaxID=57577 RepID=A0A2K3MMU9_TRIPR|nr:hypothetical protein L195_g015206 [Trifolium pratense]
MARDRSSNSYSDDLIVAKALPRFAPAAFSPDILKRLKSASPWSARRKIEKKKNKVSRIGIEIAAQGILDLLAFSV